jgi:hypothetical protein
MLVSPSSTIVETLFRGMFYSKSRKFWINSNQVNRGFERQYKNRVKDSVIKCKEDI